MFGMYGWNTDLANQIGVSSEAGIEGGVQPFRASRSSFDLCSYLANFCCCGAAEELEKLDFRSSQE